MIGSEKLNSAQITAIIIAVICAIGILLIISIPVKVSPNNVELRIPKGATLNNIAALLKDVHLIRSKEIFKFYVMAVGEDRNIQAGRYIFPQPITLPQIVYMITNGLAQPNDISIFIPEGYNTWEIDDRLTALGFIKEGEFSRLYHASEGYFFPDTYKIYAELALYLPENLIASNSNAFISALNKSEILGTIAQKMKSNFDTKTAKLLASLSPVKRKQTIIIASMLEKEARTESDMKIVSGIIQKRLALGMALQIDATVSYGACLRIFKYLNMEKLKNCDVTQIGVAKEIKIDGPYNTYTRKGLPLGPIANPGLKSLNAALNPTESPYFYYLSTRDGSQIIFSKTGAEHVANRRKYLGF